MAAAGVEVQQQAAPLSRYAEVTAAFEIVRNVQRCNLRWQPNTLDTILYEDSELARPLPRTGFVGENEILRKNVYYLATKTQKVSDALILTLVDANVLTLEEGNLILQQPTDKLRAVKLYALLVEKEDPDNSITTSVVWILHAHENLEVTRIFNERFGIVAPNTGVVEAPPNEVDGGRQEEAGADENNDDDRVEGAQGGNEDQLEEGRWACRFCTFINDADDNICEVCSKTVDFNLNDSLDVNICPQCTLMNEAESTACEACGFVFMRQMPIENTREEYSDNDVSDDEE